MRVRPLPSLAPAGTAVLKLKRWKRTTTSHCTCDLNVMESKTVRSTDFDALSCRLSARNKKYLVNDDHLMEYIVALEQALKFEYRLSSRRVFNGIVRSNKLPIINRGTYIRTKSIDIVIEKFLGQFKGQKVRILSLGSGSDTRPFKLLPGHAGTLEYVELDFPNSCKLKHAVISLSKQLCDIVGVEHVTDDGSSQDWYDSLGDLDTEQYKLIGVDLRQIDQLQVLLSKLDPKVPTLVISEAMLCYVETSTSSQVLKTLRDSFPVGCITVYDPIGGEGSFGDVMVENLKLRNLTMPSLLEFNTLSKYHQRLVNLGFGHVAIDNMYNIYENWTEVEEKQRISRLEFLDEIEELKLLLEHYCLAIGWWGFDWNQFELKMGIQS